MKIAKREHAILNALWIALLPCFTCWAQMIEIVSAEGDTVVYDAELGADLALSIRADFLDNAVTGCVFYLALPNGFFALPAGAPFSQGELLFGASEFTNDLLTQGQALGGPAGMDLLAYAVVVGPGAVRGRSGWGELARLVLKPLRSGTASIYFFQSPIYATQVVLADGQEERFFQRTRGIDIHVKRQTQTDDPSKGRRWGAIKVQAANREGQ
jgi:hypothetical protein